MTDVFPRRNLGAGEEWGRTVEGRIEGVESALGILGENQQGANRTSASTLEDLTRKAQRIEELYLAMPDSRQGYNFYSGFALGTGWNTIANLTITPPAGKLTTDILAVGDGLAVAAANGNVATGGARLVINGVGGAEIRPSFQAGNSVFYNKFNVNFGRSLTLGVGGTVSVQLQFRADNGAAFPAHGDSYGSLTVIATFVG